MIYSRLIKLIEDNADELTNRVCKDLLTREETKSYRTLTQDLLRDRIYDVYSRLDSWLNKKMQTGEVQQYYSDMGKKRFREGIPLHEVIMALMIIKRHLWLYVRENQFFDSTYECYQALELNNKVVLFFDRAIFFTIVGYEEELAESTGTDTGILSRLLKKK
ncbi:MAG: hypothetical protein ACOX3E_11945 [Desulfomonilia bacterium]|jgi:cell fate (sporulation/competence/biofilm development) regulator YlbF (YheA/YmcA/DUF963 family)|uniref:RsbT co-antagonist protein RsbRD N-terminal domain-containing protein n=1 Tax=anaerobic digester metagenome TaxID=1263854 RepID=A0A485LYG2_9ZZZZ|nr:hypothetical protein [Pseudomonadota bacterium]HON38745.1 hypothetical protein [Deltaproteobacteria bacterium]HRS56584.1 hypothetical protein [Desulfomonilia bacterium]HPD21908.1 hypothetical protein [Deltaproteobacteria bacterium]HPX18459.1 hypothetical protein [Deltaproteobacteria bacterium]